jgi:glyceraldehyde-3-phosphate dehydrogenase (NADP+)
LIVEGHHLLTEDVSTIQSPFDRRVVSTASVASGQHVERALSCAFARRSALAQTSTGERRRILTAMAEGLARRREAFVEVIVSEAGKPQTAARAEVARAIETFTLAAAELARFGGETIPVDLMPGSEGTTAEVRRVPAGVVVGIVPFNFPLNLGAHKVAPAMAVGAPIIVKPPPQAPSALLLLGSLALEVGADPAALQVLPCPVPVAEQLATDARVRVLSFTGSAAVGWKLKAKARAKAVLELGGNAAAIVRPDADLSLAAKRLCIAAFNYAGQICIKVQRIVVEEPVWESFLAAFLREVQAVVVGDPALAETLVGPVIDAQAVSRIEAWVDEALSQGARALVRGVRRGNLLSPTVLTEVPRETKAYAEEIFGPVVILERVSSFDEAIAAVNESAYGLQAALFTNSLASVRQAFRALDVGGLIVNDGPSFRSDNMPYGGCKSSGLGREGVRYAMHDFTEERVLVLRS